LGLRPPAGVASALAAIGMNLKHHGWFRAYLRFRRERPLPARLPTHGVKLFDDATLHNESDQEIYFFLEPTGLLYGAPVAFPFPDETYPRSKFYDRSMRALMIQLDATFACAVADRHYLLDSFAEDDDALDSAVQAVHEYYLHARSDEPPAAPRLQFWKRWRRGDDDYRELETTLTQRTLVRGSAVKLRTPVANIFLFLDLYHCLLWQRKRILEGEYSAAALEEQRALQTAQREALFQLIVAALYAEQRIDSSGWRLIDRLLRASHLPRARQAELRRLAGKGIALDDIPIPESPWLIRRFFLTQLVLTSYLDRVVSEREQALLDRAVERLGLWPEELAQGRSAFEAFLLNHGTEFAHEQLPKLMNLADHLREQASLAIRRNLDRLVREIKETHELYALLMKSTRDPLTVEEKRKVRLQLIDILKTIPALAIFALPGGGIILPVLIKLLPFNLLPSSFED
jgi:hypothetical protein